MTLQEAVDRKQIFGGGSSALGMAVTFVGRGDLTGIRTPLGVIVEVGEYGVWIRRFTDPADVSVHYAIRELELATPEDLVSIARTMLGWQYREAVEIRSR